MYYIQKYSDYMQGFTKDIELFRLLMVIAKVWNLNMLYNF